MTRPEPQPFPDSPEEFVAWWSPSRGHLRRYLSSNALPPIDEESQEEAGLAAADEALTYLYGVDFHEFRAGARSVHGALRAAGDWSPPTDGGTRAAFFDIDNTLIHGSSLTRLAYGLYHRGYFKLRDIIPMAIKNARYQIAGKEIARDVADGREMALRLIEGLKVDDLVSLCEEIVEEHMQYKAFPGTKELGERHIEAGEQVWLVSATPVQLGQILARTFGFTGALGTVAEVKDGRFTGRLEGDILHGSGKRHAIAALADALQLDLDECTAYSDSINDVPMLSMVGTAVAVNPDKKLRRLAGENDWLVRDYRNVRKALRTWGPVGLAGATLSIAGWRARGVLRGAAGRLARAASRRHR
ncbi:HAD family hydrolase [Corynebacterium otitidis]|uniref:HAD hydrolase, family IB n=2 Tax=Corynebacterium otitidis TaxID=29321 RepID=K0YE43_9CORY|nr:HAD-IB family hydrolase [Corynebacterium otitidis]EJZ81428.1 HAD hydrolase, family IB [Corynebacterium otitidis ATCC 51513]